MKKGYLRIAGFAIGALLLWSFGCSGDVHAPTLEGNLLDYEEIELATFSVLGNAVCSSCGPSDNFVGMQATLYLKSDPAMDLAVQMFDGLGSFEIKNLRTQKGAAIMMRGNLFWGDSVDTAPLTARAEFNAPDNDGGTVAVTLDFSSAQ